MNEGHEPLWIMFAHVDIVCTQYTYIVPSSRLLPARFLLGRGAASSNSMGGQWFNITWLAKMSRDEVHNFGVA